MRKKSTCSLCVLTAAATWTECNFPALSASWQNTTRDFPLSEEISTETNVLDYLPVDWSAPLRSLTLPMIFNGSRKRPEADQTSWRPLVKTFSVKVNHSAAGSSSTPVDGHAPFKYFLKNLTKMNYEDLMTVHTLNAEMRAVWELFVSRFHPGQGFCAFLASTNNNDSAADRMIRKTRNWPMNTRECH